jgi:hypothetical protein
MKNPLLETFERVNTALVHAWQSPGSGNYSDLHAQREEARRHYSWAVPNEEALKTIAEHSPIIELGAGKGYWAHLLQQMGADVVAYDKEPSDADNCFIVGESFTKVGVGMIRPLGEHPNRTLFLCWPYFKGTFAYRALQAYTGNTLLYVGESWGGCTGGERFHNTLEEKWELAKTVDIPNWDGIHDYLQVWVRK